MSTTVGPKYPVSVAASGAGNAWTNAANVAGIPDGSGASLALDGASKILTASPTGLGFMIPAGSRIVGIYFAISSVGGSVGTYGFTVGVTKNGTMTEEKSISGLINAGEFTVDPLGSATSMWTASWTANDINTAFGFYIKATLGAGEAASGFLLNGVGVYVVYDAYATLSERDRCARARYPR